LHTPVCIIGAGPSGTVTSLFLSKFGIPHILTDRAVFPREKVCGEFYDGRLRRVFDKIDDTLLTRMRQADVIQDIHQYSFYNTRMKALHVASKPNARISTIRTVFDAFLLNEALKSPLVTYIENNVVHSVEATGNNVVIKNRAERQTITADMAVIATGNNSSLAQKVIPRSNAHNHFMLAARGYYHNLNVPKNIHCTRNYIIQKPVRCYVFIADLPGNMATVELFVLKNIATKRKVNPKGLLLKLINEHPAFKTMFSTATLKGNITGISVPATSSKQRISGNRILLAGSSGYNINPLTGLGVGHAVFTAMHAAMQCAKSVEASDFSAAALSHYDEIIYKSLKFDNRLGKMADFGVKNLHTITNTLFNVVSASPLLTRKIGDTINKL